jgi:hypothetical protein
MRLRAVALVMVCAVATIALEAGCARKTRAALKGPRLPLAPSVSPLKPGRSGADSARRAQEKVDSVIRQLHDAPDTQVAPDTPAPTGDVAPQPIPQPAGSSGSAASPSVDADRPLVGPGGVIEITTERSSSPVVSRQLVKPMQAVFIAVALIAAVLTVPRWLDRRDGRIAKG